MHFFSPRDFHNTAKLRLSWEQALSSGREQGAAWGSQFPGATQIAQVQFPRAGRADWAFSSRLVGLGSLPRADSSGAYPVGLDQANKD